MKKLLFLTFFGLILISSIAAQNIPTYPIPSYNIQIYGSVNFQENMNTKSPFLGKGKRIQHVAVSGTTGSWATVWIYSLDGQDVHGPFTVYAGEELTDEIDEREWGVLVQSSFNLKIIVS